MPDPTHGSLRICRPYLGGSLAVHPPPLVRLPTVVTPSCSPSPIASLTQLEHSLLREKP
jgi:hypothetical protein